MSEQNTAPVEGVNDKTFTQADVDRIVSKRLAETKAKLESENAAALAQREQELAEREFTLYATELLKQNELPVDIMSALDRSDKDAFANAVKIICQHMRQPVRRGSAGGGMNPPYRSSVKQPDGDIRSAMGLK